MYECHRAEQKREAARLLQTTCYRALTVLFIPGGLLAFLGAFAKLRKATVSFVLSVCLSVRVAELGSLWTDFDEN
jgi:hypothetical protein